MNTLNERKLLGLLEAEVFIVIGIIPNDEVRFLRIYEVYRGCKDQLRVGFVDKQGRVFHYDVSDVQIVTL